MLLTQRISEVDGHVLVVQFVAACFNDVEDVVGVLARTGDSANLLLATALSFGMRYLSAVT